MNTPLILDNLVTKDLGHLLVFGLSLIIISTMTYDFNILSFSHISKIETRNLSIFEVRWSCDILLLHKLFSLKQIVIYWDGLLEVSRESMSNGGNCLILEDPFVSVVGATLGDKLLGTIQELNLSICVIIRIWCQKATRSILEL